MKKIIFLMLFIGLAFVAVEEIKAEPGQPDFSETSALYLDSYNSANYLNQNWYDSRELSEFLSENIFFSSIQNIQYLIKGLGDKCLDVSGADTKNGTNITLWSCHGGPNQLWRFTSNGELRGIGNKCLDVDASRNANGQRIQIWDCNGGPNQKWYNSSNGRIKGWGDKCLDVAGSKTSDGTPVIIYPCTGNSNQKWRLERPDPYRNINFINSTKFTALIFNSRGSLLKRIESKNYGIQKSEPGQSWIVNVEVGTGTNRRKYVGSYQATNVSSQTVRIMGEAVNAGPIFNQSQAEQICTQLAAEQRTVWTGGWWTTVPNKMSVCELVRVK